MTAAVVALCAPDAEPKAAAGDAGGTADVAARWRAVAAAAREALAAEPSIAEQELISAATVFLTPQGRVVDYGRRWRAGHFLDALTGNEDQHWLGPSDDE